MYSLYVVAPSGLALRIFNGATTFQTRLTSMTWLFLVRYGVATASLVYIFDLQLDYHTRSTRYSVKVKLFICLNCRHKQ